jgi:hypothetical protein
VKGLGFFLWHGTVRYGVAERSNAKRIAYSILRIALTVPTRPYFDNIYEYKNKYKMKNLDPALEMKIQDIKDLIYRCLR